MMHTYSPTDARLCMNYKAYWGGHNKIIFIGDSRVRQVFWEFASMFFSQKNESKVHKDVFYEDKAIELELLFRWQPMVNDLMYSDFKSFADSNTNEKPTLIVVASGSWSIKTNNASLSAKANFKANLTTIMPLIEKLHHTSSVIWMLQDDVLEQNLSPERSMITNEQINLYNAAALELFRYSSAEVWSSSRSISQAYPNYTGDGLHVSETAAKLDAQLLFNYYCNRQLNHPDATCCHTPETVTTTQYVVGTIYIALVFIAFLGFLSFYKSSNAEQREVNQPQSRFSFFIVTASRLSLVMGYMFICDRTDFFMKENKHSGLVNFFLPLFNTLALGFFFTEK